ncbi:hypothetical protein Q5752_000002 [Cryptotrichosporon argae]
MLPRVRPAQAVAFFSVLGSLATLCLIFQQPYDPYTAVYPYDESLTPTAVEYRPTSRPVSYMARVPAHADHDDLDFSTDGLVYGWEAAHARSRDESLKKRDRKEAAKTAARHPIEELIERGREHWHALLNRQSKTLPQAVTEYRRRHGRAPPRGFESWWQFCKRNGVKIVDDYDQIEHDVGPFHALTPFEFRRRAKLLENLPNSFQINFDPDAEVTFTGAQANSQRQQALLELLRPLNALMPSAFTIYVSDHDMGNFVAPDALRQSALGAVAEGRYLSDDQLKLLESRGRTQFKTLASACPEDSPAWRLAVAEAKGETIDQPRRSEITFIHDTVPTYDYCYQPDLMQYHGAFTWRPARDPSLRPVFQMSKTIRNQEFVITPLQMYFNASTEEALYVPWEDKTDSRVLWRGRGTGDTYFKRDGYDWRDSHRPRAHLVANRQDGESDVWVERKGWVKERIGNKVLNEAYLDIGLIGKPHQCKKEDGTCDEMVAEIDYKEAIKPEEIPKYKFILDIDGNGWSSRFHRLLHMGSAVIKTTVYNEWYGEWLTPWYHYIPAQVDYSDLYSIMAFFEGAPDTPQRNHDDLARQIAENGHKFALEHWRWEDMQAYMLRLLLEYNRLLADDREAASYQKSYDDIDLRK